MCMYALVYIIETMCYTKVDVVNEHVPDLTYLNNTVVRIK